MKTYASKDTIVEKQDIGYEVMDVDTETRRVKAVWARTGNIDLDNDIIVPEAFTKTLKERGPAGKNLIWSLVDHCAEMEAVIGKPEQLYIEGDMLIAITPIVETETGEDMIKMYDAGLINQHSIGFSTINSSVDKNGIRTISELKLYEGSAVLWAANPETPTISVKSEVKKEQILSNEDTLHNLGVLEFIDGKPVFNNTGILFFTKNPQLFLPQAIIQCVRYKGMIKLDIEDQKDMTSDVINNIDETFVFLRRSLLFSKSSFSS